MPAIVHTRFGPPREVLDLRDLKAPAAAIPISGFAALQALRDRGEVSPGQRVLVLGASGGVGSMAVQVARPSGPRSPNQADLDALADLVASGKVKPVVEETVPLREAPRAVDSLGTGRSRGTRAIAVGTRARR